MHFALTAGTFIVPAAQPLGVLALILLDPESDDGLATWNALDADLETGKAFPIRRVMDSIAAARRMAP